MLRVLTPKGVLQEVVKATPVCEMRNRFNKKVFRTVEFADGMDAGSTAIQMEFPPQMMTPRRSLLVGNLKTEAVGDIMRQLLAEGYYDFSSLEYQKEMPVEETVFDNGVSKPYATDYTYDTGCVYSGEGVFGGMTLMPQNGPFGCNGCGGCAGGNTESWAEGGDEDDEE